jgi:hypothetical protein
MFCFKSALNLSFSGRGGGADCRCMRVTVEEVYGPMTEKVMLWRKYASNFTVNTG